MVHKVHGYPSSPPGGSLPVHSLPRASPTQLFKTISSGKRSKRGRRLHWAQVGRRPGGAGGAGGVGRAGAGRGRLKVVSGDAQHPGGQRTL